MLVLAKLHLTVTYTSAWMQFPDSPKELDEAEQAFKCLALRVQIWARDFYYR